MASSMFKKIISLFFAVSFLSSCISISVDSGVKETPQADFVTSTLPPTSSGYIPSTPLPTSTVTETPTLAATPPPNCRDSAVLMGDLTIPDGTRMKAGEKFTKTWEFQNNGTCPWVNYTLVFAAGDQMSAPLSGPIPTTLSGAKVSISVDLIAPSTDGEYTGYFTMKNSSGKDLPIGAEKTFWVKIIVGNGSTQLSTPSSTNTPYVPKGGNSNCGYSSNGSYVQQIIASINEARKSANLPTLSVNEQLKSAAQAHSADMACNNFLDHTGSDGSSIRDRLARAGYLSVSFAEIIAIGTPQNAMNQWSSDQGHWQLVLSPGMTEIGVGYAYYASSDFGGYFTVDMGSP